VLGGKGHRLGLQLVLVLVRLHVGGVLALVDELAIATGAAVRLLARVAHHVLLEVGHRIEDLAADLALSILCGDLVALAQASAHVELQGAGGAVAIAAVGAIEGLVAGMRILLGLVDGALENDGTDLVIVLVHLALFVLHGHDLVVMVQLLALLQLLVLLGVLDVIVVHVGHNVEDGVGPVALLDGLHLLDGAVLDQLLQGHGMAVFIDDDLLGIGQGLVLPIAEGDHRMLGVIVVGGGVGIGVLGLLAVVLVLVVQLVPLLFLLPHLVFVLLLLLHLGIVLDDHGHDLLLNRGVLDTLRIHFAWLGFY